MTHGYTLKIGVELFATKGAPNLAFDRSTLWNAVEAAEKRNDAQVACEFEVGSPSRDLFAPPQPATAPVPRDVSERR